MDISDLAIKWQHITTNLNKKINSEIKQLFIVETDFLPPTSSMPQRLWHIINATHTIPKCKTCGDSNVSWDRRYKHYKQFCGNPRCVSTNPDIINQKRLNTDYKSAVNARQQTNQSKYGHTNYLCSDVGKKQIKVAYDTQTNKQKKDRYQRTTDQRLSTIQQKYNVNNFGHVHISPQSLALLNDKEWLHAQHYTKKLTLTEIADSLNISSGATTIGKYLRKHGLSTQTPTNRSAGERELYQWLCDQNISVQANDRSTIAPLELDIVLPEYGIAIEYCGLYWHSEQSGKSSRYHKNKHDLCLAKNIQLITLFEDEWNDKKEIIKQKLLYKIHKSPQRKVFARKCEIREVCTSTVGSFFNDNHIQGNGPGSVCYGLYFNDELLAAAKFIISKKGIATLNRYATCCIVVGGCSKLVSAFFQKHNQIDSIISFADKRWSAGDLYVNTQWTLVNDIPPDYSYSPDGKQRFHKFNYRRQYLPNKLHNFDASLSERVNCDQNGLLRIWDCGKSKYIIHRPQ